MAGSGLLSCRLGQAPSSLLSGMFSSVRRIEEKYSLHVVNSTNELFRHVAYRQKQRLGEREGETERETERERERARERNKSCVCRVAGVSIKRVKLTNTEPLRKSLKPSTLHHESLGFRRAPKP